MQLKTYTYAKRALEKLKIHITKVKFKNTVIPNLTTRKRKCI